MMASRTAGGSSCIFGGVRCDAKAAEADVGTAGRVFSACAGSIAVAFTATPLDVAKVRMQAAGAARSPAVLPAVGWEALGAACVSCTTSFCGAPGAVHCIDRRQAFLYEALAAAESSAVVARSARVPLGLVKTLRGIVAESGFAGLYVGLPATLMIAVPNNVLYFAAYEALKDRVALPGSFAAWSPGLAGGAARIVSATAVAPLEIVRTRMQAGKLGTHRGVVAMLADIVRHEGPRAVFSGLSSTLWRDVPFSALYWLGVERIRDHILRRHWWERSPLQAPLAAAFAGVISGGVAAFGTTPFDVAKTRQQLDRRCVAGGGKARGRRRTAAKCFAQGHVGHLAVHYEAGGCGGAIRWLRAEDSACSASLCHYVGEL